MNCTQEYVYCTVYTVHYRPFDLIGDLESVGLCKNCAVIVPINIQCLSCWVRDVRVHANETSEFIPLYETVRLSMLMAFVITLR